jgi:hypothetical protein
MDVINFSGGGAETEPANDAMVEVIHNVALAGVVPVISAGNDRDQFGMGTVGSPGTAPDAITVAATSNTHVFSPVMSVRSPGAPADSAAPTTTRTTRRRHSLRREASPGSWRSRHAATAHSSRKQNEHSVPAHSASCSPTIARARRTPFRSSSRFPPA